MEFAVYLLGVIVLSVFYAPLKAALGGGALFILAVVLYLLLVRLAGYALRRYTSARRGINGQR